MIKPYSFTGTSLAVKTAITPGSASACGGVDTPDDGMRAVGKQDFHIRLVGQVDIARIERLTSDFCVCIQPVRQNYQWIPI